MSRQQAGNARETVLPLRAGDQVILLVTQDFYRDIVDGRPSRFWGQDQAGVACAQTEPPLSADQVGRPLQLTFLAPAPEASPPEAPRQRLGYTATLLGLVSGESGGADPAPGLLLSPPSGEPEEISLRRYHRVEVRRDMGIYLVLQPYAGHPALHNFSVGGLLASFAGEPRHEHDQQVQVNLIFGDGSRVVAEALVNRVAHDPQRHRTFVGLKFTRLPVSSARVLQRKISRYSCPSHGEDLLRIDRG
jgi:hypothetical protein